MLRDDVQLISVDDHIEARFRDRFPRS